MRRWRNSTHWPGLWEGTEERWQMNYNRGNKFQSRDINRTYLSTVSNRKRRRTPSTNSHR